MGVVVGGGEESGGALQRVCRWGLGETDGFGDTNSRKRTNTQIDSWRSPAIKHAAR